MPIDLLTRRAGYVLRGGDADADRNSNRHKDGDLPPSVPRGIGGERARCVHRQAPELRARQRRRPFGVLNEPDDAEDGDDEHERGQSPAKRERHALHRGNATTAWRWDPRDASPTMTGAMADEAQIPLAEQLEEIGAQLDWVRGYL